MTNEPNINIINAIISLNGDSIAKLAKKMHITKQALYIRLKQPISLDTLKQIADIYNVPITTFFLETNEVEFNSK